MYDAMRRLERLYASLQDELSRRIFLARLNLELEPTMSNALALTSLRSGLTREQVEAGKDWKEIFASFAREGKKIVLYGASATGSLAADYLFHEGLDFYAFCARRAERFPNGVRGKPVFPPEWLFAHADEVWVAVTADNAHNREILDILAEHRFPPERILPVFGQLGWVDGPDIYFEFPELIPENGAFIDGGCFDGKDSIRFARYTKGKYSKIFAFEPDPVNCAACRKNLGAAGVRDAEVYEAGLSDTTGSARFTALSTQGSHFAAPDAGDCVLASTFRIDDIAKDERISMIKMDVEGLEWAALHGAEATIRRDRPLLAVSVYHRRGDMPAIMEYCLRLVPEYKLRLRQHQGMTYDTVLYASAGG